MDTISKTKNRIYKISFTPPPPDTYPRDILYSSADLCPAPHPYLLNQLTVIDTALVRSADNLLLYFIFIS